MVRGLHRRRGVGDPPCPPFPSTPSGLPDELARVLFNMSSVLPETFYRSAVTEGIQLSPGARGMAFNADMVVLVKFLDMGTRAAVQLR